MKKLTFICIVTILMALCLFFVEAHADVIGLKPLPDGDEVHKVEFLNASTNVPVSTPSRPAPGGGVVVPGVGDIVNPELHPLIKINSIKKTEFSYIFEINSEVTKTSQLVIALYNDLRQLTSLRVFRNELGTKAYKINYTEDSTQYKIMLIDSLSNITPLCGCLHSEFTQDNVTVSAEKYHRLGKVQVKATDGYDISVITDYYNYGSEYEFIYEDYVAVKDCKNIDTLINAKEGSLFSFAANNKDEIIAVNLISDEEYSLYVTDVVVDIYANNTRIALENHGLIDLEYAINGEEGYSYKIYYAGQEIDVTDLKIGDVISYTTDSSGKNYTIFVSREVISGTIEEMYIGAETLLVISGTEYKVAKGCYIGSRKAGDSGRFYLDVFGCVAKYKEPKVIHNYGFIVAMGEYQSVGDTAYEVKILAKDGTMITYELADQVTTNVTDDYNGDGVTGDCRFLYFNNLESKDTIYNWALSEFGQLNDRPDFSLATTTTETNLTNYAKRMVSFKVNSDGKISTMIFANYDYDLSELVYDAPNIRALYSKSTNSIGNRFLTDDTVIFHLPMCDGVISDDFEILDALEDGEEYKMIALDVDADTNEVGALIIAGKNDTDKTGDNIAVFIRSALVQNDIVKVIFLQGGEEKVIYANGDTAGTVDFASLVKGSIFSYQADENNIIKQADLVLDVTMYSDIWNNTTYTGPKSLKSYDDATWANISQNSLVAYDFGYVTGKRNGNVFTLEKANDWSEYYGFTGINTKQIVIPEDATVTIVDLTKALTSTSRVSAGHYSDIPAVITITDNYYGQAMIADRDFDFAVFVNYYNSDIIDIVAIKGAAGYFGLPMAYSSPPLY